MTKPKRGTLSSLSAELDSIFDLMEQDSWKRFSEGPAYARFLAKVKEDTLGRVQRVVMKWNSNFSEFVESSEFRADRGSDVLDSSRGQH